MLLLYNAQTAPGGGGEGWSFQRVKFNDVIRRGLRNVCIVDKFLIAKLKSETMEHDKLHFSAVD